MRPYVAQLGDYLARIAHSQGFEAKEVWAHPKNKALRESRDPDILSPGDILYVPDSRVRPEPLPLTRGAENTYVGRVSTAQVVLVLHAHDGEVLANEPYVVEGLAEESTRTSDAGGVVRFDVPLNVAEVTVVLLARAVRFPLLVGHLGPVDTPAGQRARLENLGFPSAFFDPGACDEKMRPDEAEPLRRAIKAFQQAHGLPATGVADDPTRRALVKAHGT